MTIKPEEISTLVELFEASNWDELHVELDGLHLFLSTDPSARLVSGHAPTPPAAVAGGKLPVATPHDASAATSPPNNSAPVTANDSVPAHWVAVTAPNLGTFYRAPKPGADPFVELGQRVEETTEVCLLEVMKLFTSVTAGTKGIVRRICVNDTEMVEFGQALFFIEPV